MGPFKSSIFLFLCVFYTVYCDGDGSQDSTMKASVFLKKIDGKGDEFLSIQEDPLSKAPSIDIKKPFKMNYYIYFYSADDAEHLDNAKLLNSYKACDLLDRKGDKSKIAQFPIEMTSLLFIDQDNCDFQAGPRDITVDADLPYDPKAQPDFAMPAKDRFALNIIVVSEAGKSDPKKKYVISTVWAVGIVPMKNDNAAKKQ